MCLGLISCLCWVWCRLGDLSASHLDWTHLCQVSGWTLMCLLSAGLTAAAMAEALKLQKMRMMMGFHGNSEQQRHHNGAESENDDTGTSWRHHQCLNPTSKLFCVSLSPSLFSYCPCPSSCRRQWRIMGEGAAPPLSSPLLSCSASFWFSISPPQHSTAPQCAIG